MAVIEKVEHSQIDEKDTQLANLIVTSVLDFDLQTDLVQITIHKTTMYLTAEQRDHLVYELQNLDLDQPTTGTRP